VYFKFTILVPVSAVSRKPATTFNDVVSISSSETTFTTAQAVYYLDLIRNATSAAPLALTNTYFPSVNAAVDVFIARNQGTYLAGNASEFKIQFHTTSATPSNPTPATQTATIFNVTFAAPSPPPPPPPSPANPPSTPPSPPIPPPSSPPGCYCDDYEPGYYEYRNGAMFNNPGQGTMFAPKTCVKVEGRKRICAGDRESPSFYQCPNGFQPCGGKAATGCQDDKKKAKKCKKKARKGKCKKPKWQRKCPKSCQIC
jgi:hypothetical protein